MNSKLLTQLLILPITLLISKDFFPIFNQMHKTSLMRVQTLSLSECLAAFIAFISSYTVEQLGFDLFILVEDIPI